MQPPEERLDLNAEYAGTVGKVRWQAARPTRAWLDLRLLWHEPREGVAYALACIATARETPALLRLHNSGAAILQLNGEAVWSGGADRNAQAAESLIPLKLRQGDNRLLLKLCTMRDEWRFNAEILPAAAGNLNGLRLIPATAFASRPGFARPVAPPTTPSPKPAPAGAAGASVQSADVNWKLVFADKFDRPELGKRWHIAHGTWKLADGQLLASGERAFLAYADKVAAPFRIEYEARIPGAVGADLAAFWLSDPADHGSGFLVGFGSNGNSCNKLMVDGETVTTADKPLVTPGKWHHVIVQILATGEVQLIVDGQPSLSHRVKAPGPAKFPGLWTWGATAAFRQVRLYTGTQ